MTPDDAEVAEGPDRGGFPLERVLRVDVAATASLTLLAAGAVLSPDVVGVVLAVVSGLLFTVGVVTFLWAYAVALGRSRTESLSVASVFLLTDDVVAPRVRRILRWCLVVQIVVVVAAASFRPFTVVAFGILAPLFGLGVAGLVGARTGRFGPRSGRRSGADGTGPASR